MKRKDLYSFLEENNISFDNYYFSIIILPFLVDSFLDFSINISLCFFIFTLFLIVDIIYKKKSNIILISTFLYIIYSSLFFDNLNHIILDLRFRWFSLFFLLITFLIVGISKRVSGGVKFFNLFLLFFTLTKFVFPTYDSIDSNLDYFKTIKDDNYRVNFGNISNKKSPVILIILDELSSSKEIFKYTQDSLDYQFDKQLIDYGFNSFDSFKSLSRNTKYSMPSLFNFNLHNSLIFKEYENGEFGNRSEANVNFQVNELFKKNLLLDSLSGKNIKINSYGLVSFKNHPKYLNDYLWNLTTEQKSISSFEKILRLTFFGFVEKKLKEQIRYDFFRKDVLDNLNSFIPLENNFYYFHLYVPHEPFEYFDEFKIDNNLSQLEKHIRFKRFFLPKVLNILKQDKFKKSRIIISGDHGFRSDTLIDKYKTSLYLKGYDHIDNVNSFTVQDLGYLINKSF